MDRLAFNAAAFINASRIDRQMTMNELSNVSTNGFKRSFESTMRTVKAEGSGFESRMQPQGVNTDYINMKPGTMMITGRDLDIAMNDQAVLGVTGKDGTLAFTRRGDLRLNSTGALETGNGALVRGQAGGPITIPPGFKVSINTDGSVYAVNPAQIERQVSGSFVYGLSALFLQENTVKDGRIEQTNFDNFGSMRLAQMPKVETIIIQGGGEEWGGIGEPTICVAAPAVLNAIYRATGERLRSVPLRKLGYTLV